MTMFSNVSFAWPALLAAVKNDAGGKVANATAEINSAKGRLQAAPELSVVNNPIASGCDGSFAVLTDIRAHLANAVSTFCVHPWVQGIGQGEGITRYLSPANAVTAAANKFADAPDSNAPDSAVEALCVVLSAASFKQLAAVVSQYCALFPDAQLSLCSRRAAQVAMLEQDKIELPDAAINSAFSKKRLAGFGKSPVGVSVVSTLAAHACGYEAGSVAADAELLSLADKKTQLIAQTHSAIDQLQASFTGGSGRGVFIAASQPAQIKNQLNGHGLSHDEPLAVCVVYVGAAGSLQLLREFLGL